MGNRFSARGVESAVQMGNGATLVFFDVLALAGSAVAATPWQQQLTVHFCDSERHGSGTSGFDLTEVPWTENWRAEQDFFLRLLAFAFARHGWQRLHYDPPHAGRDVLAYREMLTAFVPGPGNGSWLGDWSVPPKPPEIDLCVRHQVFRGAYDCRLCDVAIQPLHAPKVWELVSVKCSSDGLTRREVREIPTEALPHLRRLFDSGALAPVAGNEVDPQKVAARHRIEPPLLGRVDAILGTALNPDLDHFMRLAVV